MKQGKKEELRSAKRILNKIAQDANTPKNIRRVAREATRELEKEEMSLSVRSSNAIDQLQTIAEDPQIPTFARTKILEAVAKLDDLTRSG